MTLPPDFPAALQALLDAELAAGNTIAETASCFPAPPAGAYFKMARPFTTRPRESGGGLKFRDFASTYYSGSFTDERGFYFLLEPGIEPPPEPDMDAIRAAHAPKPFKPREIESDPNTPLGRFERSMVIDYIKWHDGEGYDLDAIREASAEERVAIGRLLLDRGAKDWRDVEALAALGSQDALKSAMNSSDPAIRLAVVQYAPALVPESDRAKSLVRALQTARFGGGLSQAIDQAADFHPKEVVEALIDGALNREGECAVHFAALLLFIHGQAESAFDWDQRPFFLRFNTENRKDREQVFRELCERIGVDASSYLPGVQY
jgi:hypothetical protein